MSKKCRAFSASKLGKPDSKATLREAFYAGWEAALAEQPAQPVAWRWLYNGSPDSEKCFPMPSPDADVIAKAGASEFPRTVQYLYTAPQPAKREPADPKIAPSLSDN